MRLPDLEPRWQDNGRAISFLCPCCLKIRLRVAFYGGSPWTKTGHSFEDLTISPSIDASPEHWHGWVNEGEIKNA